MAMWHNQSAYDIRCEWALDGLSAIIPNSDAVIIVDVLSFSTCVDIAVSRGVTVYPCGEANDDCRALAENVGGVLAGSRGEARFSLSPATFLHADSGERIILPSPNGGALSVQSTSIPIFTGCLRNARKVAQAAMSFGSKIAVIPAGERWPSGANRWAIEDWIGAGAIISFLERTCSPEAQAALEAFRFASERCHAILSESVSGRELIEGDDPDDVELAAEVHSSSCAPMKAFKRRYKEAKELAKREEK